MHVFGMRNLVLGSALIALVAVGLALLSGLGGERNTAEAGDPPGDSYYVCYSAPELIPLVDPPSVSIQNQFESLGADPDRGDLFCTAAVKNSNPGPALPDLRCYPILNPPPGDTVTISNQFEASRTFAVGAAVDFCVPASQVGPPVDPIPYYTCYDDLAGSPIGASVTVQSKLNPIGDLLNVDQAAVICVSSLKNGSGASSPTFSCYFVSATALHGLIVVDTQFGTEFVDAGSAVFLCVVDTKTIEPTPTDTPTPAPPATDTPTPPPPATDTPTPAPPATDTPTPAPPATDTPTPPPPATDTPTPPPATDTPTPPPPATDTPIPVDMTGTWNVTIAVGATCSFTLAQSGGTITSGTISCTALGAGSVTGSVAGTAFELSGSISGETFLASGTTDGSTLSGTWSATPGLSGTLTGTKKPPTPTPTPTKQPDPGDTDLDGCTDVAENGTDPLLGGLREYTYFWDFYDVWTHPLVNPLTWERNKVVVINDILSVAARFGPAPGGPPSKAAALAEALIEPTDDNSYHAGYDRGIVNGANNWNRAPADGFITITEDILGVAAQFGHDCS